jgi:hypothetical protein
MASRFSVKGASTRDKRCFSFKRYTASLIAAMILVEVTERLSDTQVALREADIEVIEELTSSIDEPT